MLKALVIEDDPMVSSINQKYLNSIELVECVGHARTGHEAMDLIATLRPDVILLDIFMPAMNGLELLREIRRKLIGVDVILITAADHPQIVEEAMRLGIIDYIIKPFDFARFRAAMETLKKRHCLFREHTNLNQQLIDSLHASKQKLSTGEPAAPPKGIDAVTLQMIREKLAASGTPPSAQDIADQLQLSRITARKYLEYMCETDEITLDLKYSAKGRPTKLYIYKGKM
ncbi:response regulator [Paenibacillus xerothermodurans]|uniref:Transcriptional regulatory protein n=1 Tax=Paenibacillus xerothermodurans TaxID=1977292 RepID=A0A2W1NNM6_PAEXE|nr:response regulator [Paenibacillus xerothermodurans]PZE21065.1 two-component system response regulator [Paenibacillus xerothermodurans]